MDNASKALIIAGGVLISVAVISISLRLFASARGLVYSADDEVEVSQIESFNRFYKAYSSKISGVDALNIYNKVTNNNSNENSYVEISLNISDGVMDDIKDSKNYLNSYTYKINGYSADGFVNSISIQ